MTAPHAETPFAEMKRYVRFGPDDVRALADFGGVAAPHFERIAAEFYARVREHEDAHAAFSSEEQIVGLQAMLVRWMQRLCDGPHDEAFYEERSVAGRAHVRAGLPQRYMFTAMALIRVAFEELVPELPSERHAAVRRALAVALDLELAMMLESYREDFVARLRHRERVENERLTRELARSERRYETAVELARVLVVGLDAEGAILVFNREAERLTGWARDEAVGRSFVELLLAEELRDSEAVRIMAALHGGGARAQLWEAPIRARSGRQRIVSWQLERVDATASDDPVLYAIGKDVTDERARQEQLRHGERLAAAGTLAAGLAHEIRNPLNAALLQLTYLERSLGRSPAGAEILETTRSIGAQIQRLSTLARDFLEFARPTRGTRKAASLRELCVRALHGVEAAAINAGVKLTPELSSVDLVMHIEVEKTEQALMNLLHNAIEAVEPQGGGRVRLRLRREPRHAVLEVEDDGPGLSPPDAPIFDAFYSTKARGTGLGLSIVHRVVSDHGGAIEVESQPGRTVFRVRLPVGIDGAVEGS